jgi:hypothetical protein
MSDSDRLFYSGIVMIKIKARKWSKKYKDSINCNHPKGFSQKQHCTYGRKIKKVSKGPRKTKKIMFTIV